MEEEEYLEKIIVRLKQKKFRVKKNIVFDSVFFKYVAKKIIFDRERFGAFFNTCFLFSSFQSPDFNTLINVSKKSYNLAKKDFRLYLPPVIFWGLRCFPVVIVDTLSKEVGEIISFSEPARHFGAFEKLVVFDLKTQNLLYYKLSSGIFSLADELDRNMISEILLP